MTSLASPLYVSRSRKLLTSLVLGLMGSLTGSAQTSLITSSVASLNVKAMSALTLNGLAESASEFAPSGYTGSTTTDAPCSLAFVTQPSNTQLYYAMAPLVQVAVEDCSGNVLTTAHETITLTQGVGSGLRGNLTSPTVNGVASFSVAFNVAGSDTIVATTPGLSSATSQSFSILTTKPTTPATPTTPTTTSSTPCKLAFVVQPSNAQLYYPLAPAVQVAVEDCSGNVMTSANNTITIGQGTGSGLRGILTSAATKGVASFPLAFNVAGSNTIVATSSGLTSATSQSFTIGSTSTSSLASVAAQSADAVVDSVGINVHLNYTDTPYVNFSNVESGLVSLGVRHIRDGLAYTSWSGFYSEHNQLGQLGIKSIFITDAGQSATLLESYPGMMSLCFEGFEAPNEYDNRGVSTWTTKLKAQMTTTQTAVAALSTTYPIYGASLVYPASFPALGNVASYFNYGNLHNYPGGNNPGTTGWGGSDPEGNAYGGLAWQLDLLNQTSPGLPVVTTETGYFNVVAKGTNGVPEAVSAVYLPRMVLTQWQAGIKRTYLYELVSEGGEDYGLFRNDWSPKPGFYAVSNLLNMLSDPGPAFTPAGLPMTLTGGNSNLRHLLLGKRDGSYYLALWVEASSFNLNTLTATTVASQTVSLQLPAGATVTSNQWDSAGNVTTSTTKPSGATSVTVTDKLLVLKIVQ